MNKKLRKIITIDGPAGAGKSTLARELARRLTWVYLDSGAIYRGMALAALEKGLDLADQAAVEELARAIVIEIRPGQARSEIFVNGLEVTERIRTPEISLAASKVSAFPGVREALLRLQRDMGAKGEVVAEGRDMGTVVFPDAGLKFFLKASPEARARRRYEELRERGEEVSFQEVLADQTRRDEADSSRAVSPLVAAPDAMSIDSTNLSIDEALIVMVRAFRNRFVS